MEFVAYEATWFFSFFPPPPHLSALSPCTILKPVTHSNGTHRSKEGLEGEQDRLTSNISQS